MPGEHDIPLRRARRCPICAKPAATRWQPFCSKRCADIDLGRWLGETYRIPTTDAGDQAIPTDAPDDAGRPRAQAR